MFKHYRILAALLLIPGAALADPVVVDTETNTHFYPLSYTRQVPQQRMPAHLRSDREAMANGFMRMDRAKLSAPRVYYKPAPKPEPVQVASINPMPESPIGRVDNAVLELFGNNDATQSPEFQNAMRNIGSKMKQAWPLPAASQQKISSKYGHRRDPFTKRTAFHSGVDIAAPTGTPVLASADGVVSDVAYGKRFGKYVSVRHRDGTESMYGHLSAQNVREGQQVRQGQKLGAVGSTGRSTGAHLHYTLKRNGKAVDPMLSLHAPSSVGTRVAQR